MMSRQVTIFFLTTLALLCAAPARAEDAQFFESKIRPILVDSCYKCHSATSKKIKANLLLDTKDGMLKGGDNGPSIVPGDPDKSLLIQAVRYKNEDLQMPPKEKLGDAQIKDLEAWVKMGAPDPRSSTTSAAKPATTSAAKASAYDFATERKKWAFQPPVEPKVPAVRNQGWAKSDLDRFILAKLEEKSLAPAAPADKRTLIRRATFDLIGLPPTPEEVDAFLADASPSAFAKVVDRLLASPHYGERWGRHWLDVVRYVDRFDVRSVASVYDWPETYRYRDWVVKAFNDDLPYDQFIQNQLAGDLLPAKDPKKFNADGLVATGVFMVGEWGLGDSDKEKMLTDIVDDQIDVTGKAFLGLTLACARCHDHKFDAIPTADYYSLAGIFFSSRILPSPGGKSEGSAVLRIPMATAEQLAQRKLNEARIAKLGQEIDQYLDGQYAQLGKQQLAKVPEYLQGALEYNKLSEKSEGPTVSEFALKHGLHPYALQKWLNFDGRGQLKPLNHPIRNVGEIASLSGWHGADDAQVPVALVYSGQQEVKLVTITLPPRCVSIHPTQTSAVAVGWKSPISGKIKIEGGVRDGDAVTGNGVIWSLRQERRAGSKELANGAIANGGSQLLSAGTGGSIIASIDVAAGEVIQLAVLAKDNDHTCDTTIVELNIAEAGAAGVAGGKRVWNLTADQMRLADAGKLASPSPDAYGNADVWQFSELSNPGVMGLPPDVTSILTKWTKVLNEPRDAAKAQAIIKEVTQSLVPLTAATKPATTAATIAATKPAPDPKQETALYRVLTDPKGPFWAAARRDLKNLPEAARAPVEQLQTERSTLQQQIAQPVPLAHGLQEGGTPQSMFAGIQDVPIHIRGRYDRLGEVVPRRFPRLIAGDDQKPIKEGSGRLQLAKWIASPENPLTARVMANRIWQHHFGEGIVRTPNNYGKLGVPPTHPELLDWLALRFVKSGWSIKAMHREMMLSATYQQSSIANEKTHQADPDNLMVGRMNRKRLEAEPLRDALLLVTDSLDRTLGGPAINDLNINRRTLYVMTLRSDRSNYRTLFDAADPASIVEARTDTTVAPQALFLLNNPFALTKTAALSQRVVAQAAAGDEARVKWLFQRLYARPPEAAEAKVVLQALKSAREGSNENAAWEQVCQVLLCANEFMYVD